MKKETKRRLLEAPQEKQRHQDEDAHCKTPKRQCNEVAQHRLEDIRTPDPASRVPDIETPAVTRKCKPMLEDKAYVRWCEENNNTDVLYGNIQLHPLLERVIATPVLQRLRNLKQLGNALFLHKGGSHTRLEHSIGVCYLAGRTALQLRHSQKDLNITDKDVLCLQLAGLCHDLGHGPLSHLFETLIKKLVGSMPQSELREELRMWSHEQNSCDALDHLLSEYKIDVSREEYGALGGRDIIFVKELIMGADKNYREGRGPEKAFLYDIVNNIHNGFDVDKIDYLCRDQHHVLNMRTIDNIMDSGRVKDDNHETRLSICFPDHRVPHVLNVFRARFEMHSTIYQHKMVTAIDEMICDVLLLSNDAITVPIGRTNKRCTIAQAALDPAAFTNLNDSIIERIRSEDIPGLEEPRRLLWRIENREYYTFVGEQQVHETVEDEKLWTAAIQHPDDVARQIAIPDSDDEKTGGTAALCGKDLAVVCCSMDYGAKGKNPLDCMRFFAAGSEQEAGWSRGLVLGGPLTARPVGLPAEFRSRVVRVFCKVLGKEKAAVEAFERWQRADGNLDGAEPNPDSHEISSQPVRDVRK